mgnify:CR=1 FL=1
MTVLQSEAERLTTKYNVGRTNKYAKPPFEGVPKPETNKQEISRNASINSDTDTNSPVSSHPTVYTNGAIVERPRPKPRLNNDGHKVGLEISLPLPTFQLKA